MQLPEITFILLTLILLSSLMAIFLLIKTRPHKSKETYISINDSDLRNKIKSNKLGSNLVLDPYETKILTALLNDSYGLLDIKKVNEILNLNKLTRENQRQRRHIIIKELNLKLFLILGIRESITRVSSENDRRVKYYKLIPEITDLKSIECLIPN